MRRCGWDIPPLDHTHGTQHRVQGFLLALSSFSTLVVMALASGQPCARRSSLVTETAGTELGDMGLGEVGLEAATLAQSQHQSWCLTPVSILTRPHLVFTYSYFSFHFCTKHLYYPP